jgi:hypothetical protein
MPWEGVGCALGVGAYLLDGGAAAGGGLYGEVPRGTGG